MYNVLELLRINILSFIVNEDGLFLSRNIEDIFRLQALNG